MLCSRATTVSRVAASPARTVSRPAGVRLALRPCHAAKKDNDAMSYMADAAENVVAHNFTGDKTEPPAWGGQAFSGSLHSRDRQGFHTIKDKPAGKPSTKAAEAAETEPNSTAAAAATGTTDGHKGGDGALGYLQEAAERVVGHNFTGDAGAAPPRAETGFKGDIHTRGRDGFHAIKD